MGCCSDRTKPKLNNDIDKCEENNKKSTLDNSGKENSSIEEGIFFKQTISQKSKKNKMKSKISNSKRSF